MYKTQLIDYKPLPSFALEGGRKGSDVSTINGWCQDNYNNTPQMQDLVYSIYFA